MTFVWKAKRSDTLDGVLDRCTSVGFCLSAILLVLATLIHATGLNPFQPKTAHAFGTDYTANDAEIGALVNWGTSPGHNWPEHQGNWCGIATLQVINAYAYWKQGISSQNPIQRKKALAPFYNGRAVAQIL